MENKSALMEDFELIKQQIDDYTAELNKVLEQEKQDDDEQTQISQIKDVFSKIEKATQEVMTNEEKHIISIQEMKLVKEDQFLTIHEQNKEKAKLNATIESLNKEKDEQASHIVELNVTIEGHLGTIQEQKDEKAELETQINNLEVQKTLVEESKKELEDEISQFHLMKMKLENEIKKQQEQIGNLTIEKYEAVSDYTRTREELTALQESIDKYKELNDDICSKIEDLIKQEKDIEVQDFLLQNKEMASIKNNAFLQRSLFPEKKENKVTVEVDELDYDTLNNDTISANNSIQVYAEELNTARQSQLSSRASNRDRETGMDKKQLKQVFKKVTKALKTSGLKLERGQLLSPTGLRRSSRSRSPSSPDGK